MPPLCPPISPISREASQQNDACQIRINHGKVGLLHHVTTRLKFFIQPFVSLPLFLRFIVMHVAHTEYNFKSFHRSNLYNPLPSFLLAGFPHRSLRSNFSASRGVDLLANHCCGPSGGLKRAPQEVSLCIAGSAIRLAVGLRSAPCPTDRPRPFSQPRSCPFSPSPSSYTFPPLDLQY